MLADLVPQLMASHFQQTEDGKVCGKCNEWKSNDAFSACSSRGLQRWCKQCHSENLRDWRKK